MALLGGSFLLEQAPDALGGHGDVDVGDAEVGEGVDHGVETMASGAPTVADSPTPLAPKGWWGEGVTVLSVSQSRWGAGSP